MCHATKHVAQNLFLYILFIFVFPRVLTCSSPLGVNYKRKKNRRRAVRDGRVTGETVSRRAVTAAKQADHQTVFVHWKRHKPTTTLKKHKMAKKMNSIFNRVMLLHKRRLIGSFFFKSASCLPISIFVLSPNPEPWFMQLSVVWVLRVT